MNKYEQRRWEEIIQWEERFFSYEGSDFERTYYKWTDKAMKKWGDGRKQQFLDQLDSLLFHIQAWLQNSQIQSESRKRIIAHAQVFSEDIQEITELKQLSLAQLTFIAEQYMAKQRLLAFGQGGVTGIGGLFLWSIDLPALAAVNLRSIQQLASIHGYDLNHPFEMTLVLKVFHAATLPKPFQAEAWDDLFLEVEEYSQIPLFYSGEEEVLQSAWLHQLMKQTAKNMAISMLRRKLIQGVPLAGIVLGAGMNYRFSQQVIEVAQHFYQKRYLLEKESGQ